MKDDNDAEIFKLLAAHDKELETILSAFPTLKEDIVEFSKRRTKELSDETATELGTKVAATLTTEIEQTRAKAADAIGQLHQIRTNCEQTIAELMTQSARIGTELSTDLKARHEDIKARNEQEIARMRGLSGEAAEKILALLPQLETHIEATLDRRLPAVAGEQEKLIHRQMEASHGALEATTKNELAAKADEMRTTLAADMLGKMRELAVSQEAKTFLDWFQGNWNPDQVYKRGELFCFRGSTYVCYRDARGVMPTKQSQTGSNPFYGIIAAAGSPGPKGNDGAGGGGGGGDVTIDGTPAATQVAFWGSGTSIGGHNGLKFSTTTGILTSITGFAGPLTGNVTGNAGTVTVVASTATTAYLAMFDSATGQLAAKTGSVTYDAGTDTLAVGTIDADTLNFSAWGTGTIPASKISAGTLTANITLGATSGQILIAATSALTSDGTWSGIAEAAIAGTALAFGDLCYLASSDSRYELTDADAEATAGPVKLRICVSAAAADGNATILLAYGKIRADAKFPTMTTSAPMYVSITPGLVSVAQPSGTDDVIRTIGHADTADILFFNPSNDYMTHT